VAQRILDGLREPFELFGTAVVVRASIGIAVSRRPEDGAEALVRDADVAMYTAKATGKGGFAIFQPSFYAAVVRRHALKGDLERAVDDKRFVLHYQPITDLTSGQTTSIEALVRWRHPKRGLVLPSEFIPFAEESGLILPIGRWVLERAIKEAQGWQSAGGATPPRLSVNVSARQMQQAGFVDEIAALLASSNFPASRLTLEITETLMLQDAQLMMERLQAIRDLGVCVALDDFGTGWSSISWLRDFPVDSLKIPKELIGGLGATERDWEFARAIVTLGHSLRLGIIAEGIEYADQVDRLRSIGVESGQGFFFSPPVESRQLAALLVDNPDQLPGLPHPQMRRRSGRQAQPVNALVPVAAELGLHPGRSRPN
jgi:EAL domain-containing protein (putative c-di-GMP-specific phosphodiesterase class I)